MQKIKKQVYTTVNTLSEFDEIIRLLIAHHGPQHSRLDGQPVWRIRKMVDGKINTGKRTRIKKFLNKEEPLSIVIQFFVDTKISDEDVMFIIMKHRSR